MAASFRSTERPPMPWILSCRSKESRAVSSAANFRFFGGRVAAHMLVSGPMSAVHWVMRQALGLAQAVGFYLLAAFGAALVAMVVMAFLGYAPYGDRPGP